MQPKQLIIGNKNYSSWSFRVWLMLSKLNIEFEEVYLPLRTDRFKDKILQYSPAVKVPVYLDGGTVIWDSLAIAEYLAERYPRLWPGDDRRRAHARSITAEMHSGFVALREAMPMNCRAAGRKVPQTEAVAKDIRRIQAIWTDCRTNNTEEGQWLFGSFGIADAMYAPVVSRFYTYNISADSIAAEYMNAVLEDIDVQRWYAAARHEQEVIEPVEIGLV